LLCVVVIVWSVWLLFWWTKSFSCSFGGTTTEAACDAICASLYAADAAYYDTYSKDDDDSNRDTTVTRVISMDLRDRREVFGRTVSGVNTLSEYSCQGKTMHLWCSGLLIRLRLLQRQRCWLHLQLRWQWLLFLIDKVRIQHIKIETRTKGSTIDIGCCHCEFEKRMDELYQIVFDKSQFESLYCEWEDWNKRSGWCAICNWNNSSSCLLEEEMSNQIGWWKVEAGAEQGPCGGEFIWSSWCCNWTHTQGW